MKPHRFLLFGGMKNKSDGGWQDMVNSSPTLKQAEDDAAHLMADGTYVWFHIVDMEQGSIVRRGVLGTR